jgi:hypothetical protein
VKVIETLPADAHCHPQAAQGMVSAQWLCVPSSLDPAMKMKRFTLW